VAFLDRALDRVFSSVAVDPQRIAVGGFSDGATYALSLGLMNGDLFRRIVAFSPGFLIDGPPAGKPPCFISHGVKDDILPIDQCSRRIVPVLRRREYEVDFREFAGGHEMPETIVADAFAQVKG
jgi:predicted esterase